MSYPPGPQPADTTDPSTPSEPAAPTYPVTPSTAGAEPQPIGVSPGLFMAGLIRVLFIGAWAILLLVGRRRGDQ